MSKRKILNYISQSDLDELTGLISEKEKNSSGEIRLCIKYKKHFFERKLSTGDIALREFYKNGMDKTENKTGVLFMLFLKDRKYEIIAGEGINSKITAQDWEQIKSHLTNEFSGGNYKAGLIKAINEIGNILSAHFPVSKDNRNELSDEIILEK
jgi:uncharacterized membrane protein